MNKKLLLPVLLSLLSTLLSPPVVSAAEPGEQRELQMWIVNSPPTPPVDISSSIVSKDILSASTVILDGVPTSNWTYGCTATSAGMLFGYYDRHGYPNMYTGPANGGVCPLTDLGQGIPTNPRYPVPGSCYIIATEQGLDGITTRAHVDDYWTATNMPGPDPWEGNWAEHTWGLCTADYLGTNQWKWDLSSYPGTDGNRDANVDGGTTYWTRTDGTKLYDWTPGPQYGTPETACSRGMRLFAESRGYTVLTNYNQLTDNWHASGFTFAEFQTEIDAGRPVLIHGSDPFNGGHTMLGLGYDTSTNEIYIHNTWDNNVHTMTWGGSYAGYTLRAVTVIHLQPPDTTPPTTTKTVGSPQYGDFVTTSTPITLTATDNLGGSGVKEIHYAINGAETVAPGDTVTFTFTEECTHDLEFWAVDNAGNVEMSHVQTHYVDDTPPEITLLDTPITLWPPNHKYHTVEISDFVISVADNKIPGVTIDDIVITSVSSDEPENVPDDNGDDVEGDGDTVDDIVILDSQTVQLRAERHGDRNGRVYAINFEVSDALGNMATACFYIDIPISKKSVAVNDGAGEGYTVYYP